MSSRSAEPVRVAAVDLGATSGRVMACRVGARTLHLEELHRFGNGAVPVQGSLYWDVLGIHREVLVGIREVARTGRLHGIGIDSWAVDYGLIDRDGRLVANPRSHRDSRTDGVPARVRKAVPDAELYGVTGLQQLPFNTIYQLVSELGTPALEAAERMLLLPDLLTYWLTGEVGAERTNASTTGLYDVRTGEWSQELAERTGLPLSLLPPVREPGAVVGPVVAEVAEYVGLHDVPVISVGSHDTASAVVGVPAGEESFAYISSGTWSLVGLELGSPVLTAEARKADFTNETGVDGTIRFLKNVMGLWVLSECLRTWADRRLRDVTLPALLAGAADSPALRSVVDINDPQLLAPGDMPARIQDLAREAGEPVPRTPVAITRTILDSLALAYRRNVRLAASLAGRDLDVVHVVGGGAQNALLCQLTADALELPVLAGPAEAAALGNGLVQARALRQLEGSADLPDLAAMRALIRRTHDVRRYEPTGGLDWDAAASRVG
ncbi:rhamnulokinase [Nocardioides sp. MAH-18]|uniref:Rhamnulokinase n=1 Tax=Nocardioides agri TaxID=2682843 RepID=A0A6L6XUL3_9ACTN|nr:MULTISPECIES: rhamnulokinase family protein [unclassified Nocardioides]MBA2955325.1 rhamnulokinase [Nocardioides sp. CGMCC 1.13656]MVQ50176.1 rhamnulokinase [Nocardioides sp. MAH-18]